MTVVLDGGLATALQARGLLPYEPVEPWLTTRPHEIEAAQDAFVDAGARVLLTATFRANVAEGWRELADRAMAVARRAAAGRAHVWGSIGPGGGDVLGLARRLTELGAGGIVLETFTDAGECEQAVRAARCGAWHVPIAASLCPRDDGRLWDGGDPVPALRRLLAAGATVVGFNCGTGPASIEAAVARSDVVHAPLWAKPSRGDADDAALLASLLRLSRRCRYVGGCCGVEAGMIAAFARRVRKTPPDEVPRRDASDW